MSLSLTLFIAESSRPSCDLAHDMLTINYCPTTILDVIQEVEDEHGIDVIRGGISTFMGRGNKYGKTTNSPITDKGRMKSVTAGQLKKAFKKYKQDKSEWNENAIIAYVKKLPNDLPIFLYWS